MIFGRNNWPHSPAAPGRLQSEIDDRCFDLYGFTAADRAAPLGTDVAADVTTIQADSDDATDTDEPEDEDSAPSASQRCNPQTLAAELFDWLVGTAFGRFDLRLATGERKPPPEPEPFDPLPVCLPGMLCGELANRTAGVGVEPVRFVPHRTLRPYTRDE